MLRKFKTFISALLIVVVLICIALPAIADVTVYITETGTRYHAAGCRHLTKSQIPISLSDALARGLTPCGTCRPQSAQPAPSQPAPDKPETISIQPNSLHFVRVSRVVDGDTIDVMFENGAKPERVRLIGVDTPETKHPNRGIEYYGKEASDFTTTALLNRDVWLQFDVGPRDRYQRLLGYVWTEKPNDGMNEQEIREKMFNARLLLDGYAQVMTIQPNSKYADIFVKFQREARENNRGLWDKP